MKVRRFSICRSQVGRDAHSEPQRATELLAPLQPLRRFLAWLSLFLVAGFVLFLAMAMGASALTHRLDAGRESDIRLLESSEERIVVEVDIPDYAAAKQAVDGEEYDVITLDDWGLTDEAGAPQLPMRRFLLGIPSGAEIQLQVLDADALVRGPVRMLPAPDMVVEEDLQQQPGLWITPPSVERRFEESPEVYEHDVFYPGVVARLGEIGFIRSQRVVAVELYPIQVNPVSQQMQFYPRFRVVLSFAYPEQRQLSQAVVAESPGFEQVLQEQLLNYSPARDWRSVAAQPLAADHVALASDAYKITVLQDGIYQLARDDLEAAGLPVGTLDPRKLQMFSMGEEIAIRVVGEGDGRLDADDYVLFYGQGIRNKYTERNVYWLTYGQAPGRRMPTRDGKPSGSLPSPLVFSSHLRMEEDTYYLSQWPGDDATDRWYQQWSATDKMTVTVRADLGSVSTEAISSTLWVFMKGRTKGPHSAAFYVNDHYIGAYSWDGMDTAESVPVKFDQSLLSAGTISFTTVTDYVLFDRYELDYGHAYRADSDQLEFTQTAGGAWEYVITDFTGPDVQVYDISDPMNVVQILRPAIEVSGATYTLRFSDTVPVSRTYLALTSDCWLAPTDLSLDAPSDLHDAGNGADYIIISHADFMASAQKLANYRAGQGLRTRIVDVQDVYDEFGFGLPIPQAIRDFLRYAFDHWQPPAPTYVVLLGDGTYDPKGNVAGGATNYLTPYLGFVDLGPGDTTANRLGETAIDNWYVAIVGEDILPDMFVGRLPANSLAEANAVVDKTITYERSMGGKDWNRRVTFVAGRQPDPKAAGNFHNLSEAIVEDHVPSIYGVSRIYLGDPISAPDATCGSGPECEDQLIAAMNAGTLLVNYIGHGSVAFWDGTKILSWDTLERNPEEGGLTNADRLAIMLPMTCLDGYFIHPYVLAPHHDYPSLSELVVRTAGKGAVASWGPTGLGVATGHDELDRGFLNAVLRNGIRQLGPATYLGKLRLYATRTSLEQIQEYTLFGDPALHIHAQARLYLPLIQRTQQ